MIRALYVKWDNSPGIVSFATKASDVSDIPFPAITICPEVKSQISRFNFTDAYHKHKAIKLDKTSLNTFITMWQICDLGTGIDQSCIQGYKIQLHTPTDYPSLSNYIQVPLDQEVSVEVIPHLALTTDSIRHYNPKRRNCFFQEERKLRFFSVYSQANCELECLSNYTVKLCGCTRFSMPRARLVPVCGVGAMRCYQMAEYSLLRMDIYGDRLTFKDGCQCMPACSTLQYDAEISQADFDWHHMKQFELDRMERIHLSYLIVYFKEPEFIAIKRSELYGDTEFLANCGGLLGLFLGVSLLSFAEILYYCTLKPFVLWWNWRRSR
ncbi:pickpocket protein 28 [Culex quinquefasciatus]|uniref:pickpocket protein 28 n=1 Tax=Culex quinquefasciatus TaxID=7176 RepID=UPI0018E2B314|nr:pickpocket protein 28 [Culex quinquefasciatus]